MIFFKFLKVFLLHLLHFFNQQLYFVNKSYFIYFNNSIIKDQ